MNSRRIIFSALLLTACGASTPPKELLDARSAFERARNGQAAQLKPEVVHEAKVSLDQAEASFSDDGNSDKTRDLAYVAQRKSELAVAQAGAAGANAEKEQAAKDLVAAQAQGLQRAQGELSQTKQQLAAAGQQLNMTGQQLEQERKARLDAEKRAKDAMDRLAVAAALAVKEEPRGTVITLPGAVLFSTAKWELLPGAREKLDQVAEALKNQADHKMIVEGHTDSQGNESSNLELGQRRAQSVRDYLVSRGVPTDIITAVGIGQGRPVADNKTPEGRAQNRRVEIIVQPVEKR
jgi:outer membrane protein OmpA-like peptidoglycan-associated protein